MGGTLPPVAKRQHDLGEEPSPFLPLPRLAATGIYNSPSVTVVARCPATIAVVLRWVFKGRVRGDLPAISVVVEVRAVDAEVFKLREGKVIWVCGVAAADPAVVLQGVEEVPSLHRDMIHLHAKPYVAMQLP